MTKIWRKISHEGDETYAYCGRMNGDKYEEKCSYYNPDKMCRNCKYVGGKAIDEEREEE